jgi:hypothetical protein
MFVLKFSGIQNILLKFLKDLLGFWIRSSEGDKVFTQVTGQFYTLQQII